jgi:cellulose biosynthesis protein BcsQ
MKISLFNMKGGVGKSVISLNLALTLDYPLVTNESYGQLGNILPKGDFHRLDFSDKTVPRYSDDSDIIFDLGGYVDSKVEGILLQSDCILIPIIYGTRDDIQVSINTIREVESYNPNILLIANRTNKGDKNRLKDIFSDFFDYKMLEIKQSTALKNLYEYKTSVEEMLELGGIYAFHYRIVVNQFKLIINYLRKLYE